MTETPAEHAAAEALAHADRERLARLDRRRSARAAQGLPPETPEEAEAAVAAIMAAAAAPAPPAPPEPAPPAPPEPAPPAPPPFAAAGATTEQAIAHLEAFIREAAERSKAAFAAGDEATALAAAETVRSGSSLLVQLRSTLSGALDAKVLLKRQPTAAQLALPGRRPVLVGQARAAVARTKWAFMSPEAILGSLAAVLGPDSRDVAELEHRILHFLASGNLAADGLQAAAFVSRLVSAGKAAVRLAGEGALASDERAVAGMRAILLGFLERARAAV